MGPLIIFSHFHSKINIYGEQFNETGQNNSITRQLNYDKVTSGYLVLETHYYIRTNRQELTIIMIRKLTQCHDHYKIFRTNLYRNFKNLA